MGTHISDIVEHTNYKAQTHIRLMSVTIIVVCLRLLKTSQILIPKFGSLVQVLYFASSDIFGWFFVFACIWLSFS